MITFLVITRKDAQRLCSRTPSSLLQKASRAKSMLQSSSERVSDFGHSPRLVPRADHLSWLPILRKAKSAT